MEYTQDWLMKQINMLVSFVAKLIFNKDSVLYVVEDENNLTSSDTLYNELQVLLSKNKICEAEDLLFDDIDMRTNFSCDFDDFANEHNYNYLKLAVDFYQKLNKLDDKTLLSNNFSREEIGEGLNQILKKFEISEFLDINN